MQAIIEPGRINGTIHIPASKSMMQRVCAAALLHKGKTVIDNPGHSDDDRAALGILEQCGATIHSLHETCIEINSNGVTPLADEISVGESGLSARLFMPVLALSGKKITINGKGSLLKRPMNELQHILPELGVMVTPLQQSGYLPFSIQGPLHARGLSISGSVSSQYLTGLLFAMAQAADMSISVHVANLKSKPYIDMTLEVLQQFRYKVYNDNYTRFDITPVQPVANTIHTSIDGDWSSAAYWLVAGAISGSVTLQGLNMASTQADRAIVDLLKRAGGRMEIHETGVTVEKSALRAFRFDATHCPDLFPVLAILAACCKGESVIKGVHRLLHKESNRAESIAEMLEQYGVFYSVNEDSFVIEGRPSLQQASVDAFGDHRIVMAAAIGALRAEDTVIINGTEAVRKSYPGFFTHLQSAGVECTITD